MEPLSPKQRIALQVGELVLQNLALQMECERLQALVPEVPNVSS